MRLVTDPFGEPPRLRPKRKNAIVLLYDAPIYRDWAFWLTAFWAFMTAWAIGSSPSTSSMPLWLDTTLATLVFAGAGGVVPAAIRLQFRKWFWRRNRRRQSAADVGFPVAMPEVVPQNSPILLPRAQESEESFVVYKPRIELEKTDVEPRAVQLEKKLRERWEPTGTDSDSLQEVQANISPLPTDGAKARPDNVVDRSRVALPYPTARAARSLSLVGTARDEYEAVLVASEALTLTLGLTVAAWAKAEGLDSSLANLHAAYLDRGVAQGHWHDAIRDVAKASVGHQYALVGLQEALRLGKGGSGLLKDLRTVLEERNRWAHGARPQNPAECGSRVSEFRPALERALVKSLFLEQMPWILVESSSYDRLEGNFEISGYKAMGDHPEFERIVFKSNVPLANDNFYVKVRARFIDLSPFVVMRYCETCRQPEVFYADRVDSKQGVCLKSFGRGHVIFDPSLTREIQTLRNAG